MSQTAENVVLKRCPCCGLHKPATLAFFYKGSKWRDGFKPYCKVCQIAQSRAYAVANPEKKRANRRKWLKENPGYVKKYRAARLEREPGLWEEWTLKAKERRQRKHEHFREKRRLQSAKRRQSPRVGLEHRVAQSMRTALRRRQSKWKWGKILGYTVGTLVNHIERQFADGMSWSNMGSWQIDHIVPLHLFAYTTETDEGFKAAWSLTNLRPIWPLENQRKGRRRTHLL